MFVIVPILKKVRHGDSKCCHLSQYNKKRT